MASLDDQEFTAKKTTITLHFVRLHKVRRKGILNVKELIRSMKQEKGRDKGKSEIDGW